MNLHVLGHQIVIWLQFSGTGRTFKELERKRFGVFAPAPVYLALETILVEQVLAFKHNHVLVPKGFCETDGAEAISVLAVSLGRVGLNTLWQ